MNTIVYCLITLACASLIAGQNTFKSVSVVYRNTNYSPSNVNLYVDSTRRRLVVSNFAGPNVVRVVMDSNVATVGQLLNADTQGGGVIDANGNYFVYSCFNGKAYFNSYDVTSMTSRFNSLANGVSCAEIPNCMTLDSSSRTAIFTLASSNTVGLVNIDTGAFVNTNVASLNDGKFSCTFNNLNRTAYFAGSQGSITAVTLTGANGTQINNIPVDGTFSQIKYTTPILSYDNVNQELYLTAKGNETVITRYSPSTKRWSAVRNQLGEPNGILVDSTFNTAYAFTDRFTLTTPDANFTQLQSSPINAWSLKGVGYTDVSTATGTTSAYTLVNDIAQVVLLSPTSSATTHSFVIGIIVSLFVTLFVL
ncbi:hypothetical protein AKO1_002562 [Acrasis kona]|uniref:Uncharacterized protein n=1 Tax=Acrasis kona TaxID=1008807 RepID=A0AAW2ZNA3_9EUKA